MEGQPLAKLAEGETLPLIETELRQGEMSTPEYPTERKLISLRNSKYPFDYAGHGRTAAAQTGGG